jgi:hypothetical protein
MAREKRTVGFGDIANRVIGKADRKGKRHGAGAVLAWREVAGEAIAGHTKGFALREKGELVVFVDSAGWANQLALMSSDLIDRLNSALGEDSVKSIRFTVSRKVAAEAMWGVLTGDDLDNGGSNEPDPVPLDATEARQAAYIADAVGDPELREVALRVMTRDLELKKARRLKRAEGALEAAAGDSAETVAGGTSKEPPDGDSAH